MENKYGLDLAIGGLWYTPFWKTNGFYVIFSLILVVLIAVVIYRWWLSSKKSSKQDPILLLVQSLCEVQDRPLNASAQAFYFDLVLKFKEFMGYKYQLELRQKTDSEVKKFLFKNNLDNLEINQQLVMTFLEILDRSYVARFAKNDISKDQMRSDLQKTIDLMQQTVHESCEKL